MATEPNPKYDNKNTYIPFQADCEDCQDNSSEDCSCCPPGLVAVYDDCGKHLGCLTPNDAEHYASSLKECAEGYAKLFHPVTGEFLGCVSPADFVTMLNALNA